MIHTPLSPKTRPAPLHLRELLLRAEALSGHTVGEVARALDVSLSPLPRRSKGACGTLVERALGAHAGSAPGPDFADLGIELKTLPLTRAFRPRESTYVCALNLATIADESWATSTVRRKLARVLWVPVEGADSGPLAGRRFLPPFLFELHQGQAEDRSLQGDWEELVGLVGVGGVEKLSGRVGRCLQVRPKAARGSDRTTSLSEDGWLGATATCPRGFYLRTSFTAGILPRRNGPPLGPHLW